jgi:HAD superfamily hydrolase (TIGR01509 family)
MLHPKKPIRAVIFDHDGLIFNTEELYQQVGTELLRRRRKTFDAELLNMMMGRPSKISLQIMIDYHELTDTPVQLSEETAVIFDDILTHQLQPMPGALDLFAALEVANIPKGIGTSSGPKFIQRCLGQFNLVERFEFILTCDDVINGKPDPEIYLKGASRFSLDPSEVMVLEDSQHGCRAAISAGTYAVAVPGGHSLTHNFDGAAFIAETLADPRIYDALGISNHK